jgi:hypothetical protein
MRLLNRSPRISGVLVAVAAAAGVLGFSAAPSAAATVTATCPSGWLCLYDGPNFTGDDIAFPPGSECVDLEPLGWAGRAESVINNGTGIAAGFQGPDCQGDPYGIEPGQHPTTIPNLQSVWFRD